MLSHRRLAFALLIGLGLLSFEPARADGGPFGNAPVLARDGVRQAPTSLPPLPPSALPAMSVGSKARFAGATASAASPVLWPSADPRGLPPLPTEPDSRLSPAGRPQQAAQLAAQTASALMLSMVVISPMGSKALFGDEWARLNDVVPGQTTVRIVGICSGRVVLNSGARVRVGEAVPHSPTSKTQKLKTTGSDACL